MGRWWRGRRAWLDGSVVLGYLLAATYVTSRLWSRPDEMTYADNDQILFEWMLARAARALTHLENPFYSTSLNAPDGLNLMANTSVLGLGIPLAPVTLLLGSRVAFLVALVISLAGTATAWYLFLSRRLVDSRVAAAAVGGLFGGFAPGMVSQATGHLHMVSQFLVPLILWLVFHPGTDRVIRRGLLLGVVVAYQVFLGEEVLAFLVLACGLFTVAYAVAAPGTARRLARPFLGRLGVGALTGLVLLAYPLWFQFFGPGHYRGLPFDPGSYSLDVRSFSAYARQSVAGHESVPGRLAPNAAEENSFFGLALIALCAVVVLWQWRRPLVKALTVCGVVFAALSLGGTVRFDGQRTDLVGPYQLLRALPIIDLAVPARFPLICVPIIAILLAISIDQVSRAAPTRQPATPPPATPPPAGERPATPPPAEEQPAVAPPAEEQPAWAPFRLLWIGAVIAVLLPLAPLPIRTKPAWPVPEFVTSGQWREYVPPGRTLVPVPPTTGGEAIAGMYWSARTGLAFTAPGGYFIGPTGPADPRARWGSPDRPTALLLDRVAYTGQIPVITDVERAQAVEDLRHWRAAVVVQGGLHRGNPVRETIDLLLGPGRDIAGAWVWDVRPLVG